MTSINHLRPRGQLSPWFWPVWLLAIAGFITFGQVLAASNVRCALSLPVALVTLQRHCSDLEALMIRSGL